MEITLTFRARVSINTQGIAAGIAAFEHMKEA
jgi:hypothetical protein